MREVCQTEVEPVPRPEMAAEDKDIVITATTSREPVFNGHWIAEGTHINAVGSNFLGKAEIDAVAVRRCDVIVVDSKDQARLEAGDFVAALEEGSIHWADVHELGQVIVGRSTGRAHPQDVTLFKSLGIAIEDVAVAARVYARAQAEGIGVLREESAECPPICRWRCKRLPMSERPRPTCGACPWSTSWKQRRRPPSARSPWKAWTCCIFAVPTC